MERIRYIEYEYHHRGQHRLLEALTMTKEIILVDTMECRYKAVIEADISRMVLHEWGNHNI